MLNSIFSKFLYQNSHFEINICHFKTVLSRKFHATTDLSTLILKIKKSTFRAICRLKAVIKAGGCHVEGKRLDLSLKLLQLLFTVVTI